MQQGQGRRLLQRDVATIQRLLADTDMTISEIVERLGHSKAVILSVNRRFGIRIYQRRSVWFVNQDWKLPKAG
jgi:hypothetical protein